MPPRHFWWLAETLEEPTKRGPSIGETDRNQMLAMLRKAKAK